MKKIIITIVLLTLTVVANAQVAPEVYNYNPTYIQYDSGKKADVTDYRWKINNQVWLKAYQDGKIELKISQELPVEFYSLGPIDMYSVNLTGNQRSYFLKYISLSNNEYTYWSDRYNMYIYISADTKKISYKINGTNYRVFNEFNDFRNHNYNVRRDQPSPFKK